MATTTRHLRPCGAGFHRPPGSGPEPSGHVAGFARRSGGPRAASLRRGLLLAATLLGAGCAGRTLVRTEGSPLALGSHDLGETMAFTGEAEAPSRARALEEAEADARRQALETLAVHVRSELRHRVETRKLGDAVVVDERVESELRSAAQGTLEGASRSGEPYLEYYSDGAVRARVRIEVPKASLDYDRLIEKTLERQGVEHVRAGRLEEARRTYWALNKLRPSDPLPFLQLARVEEEAMARDPAARGRALEHLKRALGLNASRPLLQVPGAGPVDLLAEIDRLTPHWENLLAEIGRLEEAARDLESFSVTSSHARYSRSGGEPVRLRLHSRERRLVALLWIDADGLYPLEPFGESPSGKFSPLEGREALELDLGTVNGRVRVVALSVAPEAAGEAPLEDISSAAVGERERGAVEGLARLRRFLEGEAAGGTLRVVSTAFEIVP